MAEDLIVHSEGAVRVLTLNRPEKLNALNPAMHEALADAFTAIESDDSVRAVLLTGAGRGFCAGADLTQNMGSEMRDLGASIDKHYNPLVRRMRTLPKPVVSAVNGVAAGAGANLALAADIVIAAESANFTQAFIRIGLMPDAGGTHFLPHLVGDARARGLAMTGETITARQAAEWGLIWRCLPDEGFMDAALALAADLAAKPTQALAAIKRALNASGTNDMDAQLDLERDLQRGLGRTPDFVEGVRAFAEKRPARFTGAPASRR
ncbi:2-(1,2-epoxy-1,2-dihydrophenyl)acetyl-CoA isomerase PaaG [Acidiphilium sp. AL]|uniref:2-(1,2-epoxy-1,2-dihydrophenyl)acetyl-CoA isomerase PaaG n=1 Tax=Acidiphilium iwatense TaxID=768198 RepID=A0ABS9DU04_9PROT|nr:MULTISPECIES: 2-(1,2-epoxy-1,2-dihydrophenyl)acetyl-CoA isomerase PaaG [Acidiphilium]MCF3946208.1 2-(1,2-epoxy-1,2-dihydrophenyl)acetyl-CoA isomerase PaaG [Acidiphilium iwatense]MCU4158780.1 2-(1,2-epoxy-1,2-dihydrophenyl)acetyl-CoA isomerase PaaG [Acidiphilium sp. AL]